MFWIAARETVSNLPNAHGPIETLDEAETFAGKLINPGDYKILDGEGKLVSQVTISAPKAEVRRTK